MIMRRTAGLTRTITTLLALFSLALASAPASAKRPPPKVEVSGPYIELHSGPGRGFPVFHTVERGGEVELLKRRTDWYRVRTGRDIEGWVSRSDLDRVSGDERLMRSPRDVALDDYLGRNFELGFATGDFDGDQAFTARGGYRLSDHFLAELALTQVSGTFSSTTLYNANLLVMPAATWRVSPFFTLGIGRFENDPKDVLVDDDEINEWAANAGVGVRAYLTRRFLLRADYRRYTVMVDDDKNEDFDEWGLGFSVFF